jgi:hypothetical protein
VSVLRVRYMLDGPGGYDERHVNVPIPSLQQIIYVALAASLGSMLFRALDKFRKA